MTDLATLEALLARIEAATGPNRELDHRIHHVLIEPIGKMMFNKKLYGGHFISADVFAPNYTASIDAALALVEKVIPRHSAVILSAAVTNLSRRHNRFLTDIRLEEWPLAILAALFRVLIAQAKEQAP